MSIKKHFVVFIMGLSLLLLWVYARPVVAPLPETTPLTLSAFTSANIAKAAEPESLMMQSEADDTSANLPPTAPQAQISAQVVVVLTPIADAFLTERDPDNNTGGHSHVAAGRDGVVLADGGKIRRGVFAFDIAGNIPAGSTINSAAFSIDVIQVPNSGAVNSTFELHRMTRDWTEGDNFGNNGAAAQTGEVTWNWAKHNTLNWTTDGGDFAGLTHHVSVSGLGSYNWFSTVNMVNDVQLWLDSPSTNFGWLLKSADEGTVGTVRAFGSKEGGSPATLTIDYTPPADLEISKSASADQIEVGEILTYTVSVTNNGPGGATSITMVDTLPPEVAYQKYYTSTDSWTCNEVSKTVTCTLPSLANGATSDIFIVVTAPNFTGTITNTAAVSAAETDLISSNTDRISTTVIEPKSNVYLPILIK